MCTSHFVPLGGVHHVKFSETEERNIFLISLLHPRLNVSQIMISNPQAITFLSVFLIHFSN